MRMKTREDRDNAPVVATAFEISEYIRDDAAEDTVEANEAFVKAHIPPVVQEAARLLLVLYEQRRCEGASFDHGIYEMVSLIGLAVKRVPVEKRQDAMDKSWHITLVTALGLPDPAAKIMKVDLPAATMVLTENIEFYDGPDPSVN